MQCGFCGREVAPGVSECPYCHYRMEIDAQVLRPDERDAFDGVTIEEDGTASEGAQVSNPAEERRTEGAYQNGQGGPHVEVHTYGCGSGILMTLLILGGILALFFFLLPTFIVFAAVGAVIVFILRLFM